MPTAPEHHPVAPAPRVPDDLDEMRPPPASEATGDVPSERGSEDEDLSQQKDRPPRSPTPPNKAAEVLEACLAGDRGALAILATSNGGLLSDELRRRAWPILLGSDRSDPDDPAARQDDADGAWEALPPHSDEEQVRLDVNRSFVNYPTDLSETQLDGRKRQLSRLITRILRTNPMLCYFQGYHDIAQVFLLVFEPSPPQPPPADGEKYAVNGRDDPSRECADALARLSLLRIRDFMLPSMGGSMPHLHLIPAVLRAADPELASHVAGVAPFFALGATLTLYAHEVTGYADVVRLFDFLLAREAVLSVYLFAAIILHQKPALLEIPPSDGDMLHFTLSRLPPSLDADALVHSAASLRDAYPPSSLPGFAWWRIVPQASVLRTTADSSAAVVSLGEKGGTSAADQTLAQGRRWFAVEAARLRREEARARALKKVSAAARMAWRRHGGPRRAALLGTVLVGLLAYWMREEGSPWWSVGDGLVRRVAGLLGARAR